MPQFVHLNISSDFSFEYGCGSPVDYVKLANELGFDCIALLDHNSSAGAVPFNRSALSSEIKPINGIRAILEVNGTPHPLLLVAEDPNGMAALSKMSVATSVVQASVVPGDVVAQTDFSHVFAITDFDRHPMMEDLLSGGSKEMTRAKSYFSDLKNLGFSEVFLEVQRNTAPDANEKTDATVLFAQENQANLVATNGVIMPHPSDLAAYHAKRAVLEKTTLDQVLIPNGYENRYLKSEEEMHALFSDLPRALANTRLIADSCLPGLEVNSKPRLPDYPAPDGLGSKQYLQKLALEGLERKVIAAGVCNPELEGRTEADYRARLSHELDVIDQSGFPGYMLIVWDFINWSRNNGVAVGLGRGSIAGSLVAYCLDIAQADPLEYNLLFERFLNSERISLPDVDVDFADRDAVFEYLKEKYGFFSVSKVSSSMYFRSKSAMSSAAGILGIDKSVAERFNRYIGPIESTQSFDEILRSNYRAANELRSSPELQRILETARLLEDRVRTHGTHAGGIVLAPNEISATCGATFSADQGFLITQADKDEVENLGLVKFDFLGLKNLAALDECKTLIQATGYKGDPFLEVDYKDPMVFELFAAGNLAGVFQCSGESMRKLAISMKVDCMEDVCSLLALNRPGPMNTGMDKTFVDRKHEFKRTGEMDPAWLLHPLIADVLRPTYGVIVYQEQAMQIAQRLAGYTLGGADILRKAMGKKDKKVMADQLERFVTGSKEKGVDEDLAKEIFRLIESFSEYGFNRSHSVVYAKTAYLTAWSKVYYPAQFMTSFMNIKAGKLEDLQPVVQDAIQNCQTVAGHALCLVAPNINTAGARFLTESSYTGDPKEVGSIQYGLMGLKGVGEDKVTGFLQERDQNGPFVDIFDFAVRAKPLKLNKTALLAFAKCGAFDGLHLEPRADIVASIEALSDWLARRSTAEKKYLIKFGKIDNNFASYCPKRPDFSRAVDLSTSAQMSGEKEVAGFVLSTKDDSDAKLVQNHPRIKSLSDFNPTSGIFFFAKQLGIRRSVDGYTMYLESAGEIQEVPVSGSFVSTHRLALLKKGVQVFKTGSLGSMDIIDMRTPSQMAMLLKQRSQRMAAVMSSPSSLAA